MRVGMVSENACCILCIIHIMNHDVYNILIVEDEWINAVYLSDLIVSFGQKVIAVAKSAKETHEILSRESCDIIFMDINIKGATDGIQLAYEINRKQDIPIIFITAFGDSVTIAHASETNIYGFVVKPFNEIHIESALQVAIARMKKEKQEKDSIDSMETLCLNLGEGYTYSLDKKMLMYKQKPISLSKNESEVLFLLCSNMNQVTSCEKLRFDVWHGKNVADSTIRDTILRVRKKIPYLKIENVIGIGYMLTSEQQ